jgi:hypothetical protein
MWGSTYSLQLVVLQGLSVILVVRVHAYMLLLLESHNLSLLLEIVMVRLQGDFAKPPEKRFNYKHCFDALFRVSLSLNPVSDCMM